MPYVRTVKTASGATAVQVIYSSHGGSRDIGHVGSACGEAGLGTEGRAWRPGLDPRPRLPALPVLGSGVAGQSLPAANRAGVVCCRICVIGTGEQMGGRVRAVWLDLGGRCVMLAEFFDAYAEL